MTYKQTRNSTYFSHLIYVLVNQTLWTNSDVQDRIFRYAEDVESLGLGVSIFSLEAKYPEDVRSLLQHAGKNLIGCLIVGNIPVAWYEMDCKWGSIIVHEEFPMDLFYMDLDGIWTDSDGDGTYDEHSGNKAPEIWVGRLEASRMARSEIFLIENYFDKNHDYRNGYLSLPLRALAYIDDDWEQNAVSTETAIEKAYGNCTLISNRYTTNKTDYVQRLTQGWNLVHVKCHGGITAQRFKIPNATDPSKSVWESKHLSGSQDVYTSDPAIFFYNLFVCESARFTEQDYIGGWYIFTRTYGLTVIGSTKQGGMQTKTEEWFYDSLSEGKIFGEAFKEWFISWGEADPKWTYGMVILGDPVLDINPPNKVDLQTDVNGDGKVNILDITIVAKAYLSKPEDPNWNSLADLDENGVINILDISLIARDYR